MGNDRNADFSAEQILWKATIQYNMIRMTIAGVVLCIIFLFNVKFESQLLAAYIETCVMCIVVPSISWLMLGLPYFLIVRKMDKSPNMPKFITATLVYCKLSLGIFHIIGKMFGIFSPKIGEAIETNLDKIFVLFFILPFTVLGIAADPFLFIAWKIKPTIFPTKPKFMEFLASLIIVKPQ